MKLPIRLLLASAALLITSIGHCLAQSNTVTMALSGTLQTGKSIKINSGTEKINPAEVYTYSISGTCHAVGTTFQDILGTGELTVTSVVERAAPKLVQYLQGTILDPKAKFPFTCVNKLEQGSFKIGGTIPVSASLKVKAGITDKGICYGELTNFTFYIDHKPDTTDAIVIDGGQVVVQVAATSGTSATPNLSFVSPIGHLDGIGVTGTAAAGHSEALTFDRKGEKISLAVALENSGTAGGSFVVTAPAITAAGFAEKFLYKGRNETAAVNGAGLTVPSTTGTLASGDAVTFTWVVEDKTAVSGTSFSTVLTAVPSVTGTAQDQILVTGTTQ